MGFAKKSDWVNTSLSYALATELQRMDDELQKLADTPNVVLEENIEDHAVTTPKIADGAVTMPKIAEEVFDELNTRYNDVVNLGVVDDLSTLNACTDTQKEYFFKVGNSLQGEFEYMTNNAFGILNCYKVSDNKYMQTVKIIGGVEFTYKRTYDNEQGSWTAFALVSDGRYYELNSKIDVIDSTVALNTANITQNTADITKLKTDVLDNTEAITQNTADIDVLKVKTLPSVNLTLTGVTNIPDFAFCANQSIASVTIINGIKTIGVGVFQNCTSLASVTIPNSVTSIGSYTFKDCTSLTSITIPNSVTNIGISAFQSCTNLASITMGNGVTSIGRNTFSYCTSLTDVTIPDSVTSIDSAFVNCASLTSITIPSSVTTLYKDTLQGCRNLTNVTLGNGFNANNLNLASSTKYTADTIVSWLNALADRTGQTAYTLKIGATNKAKLTAEQLAIATNKNWNIS